MEKTGLKITAAILAGLMGLVWFAGLDDLPRDVRAQIAAERSALATSQKEVAADKEEVARNLSSESQLFQAIPSAALYKDRLERADNVLSSASRDAERLGQLEKANRRADEQQVRQLLDHERKTRAAAVADAESVR